MVDTNYILEERVESFFIRNSNLSDTKPLKQFIQTIEKTDPITTKFETSTQRNSTIKTKKYNILM